MLRIFCIIFIQFLLLFGLSTDAFSMNQTAAIPKAVWYQGFEKPISTDDPMIMSLNISGGQYAADGVSGKALRLGPEAFFILNAAALGKMDSGTISLWIRPHWNTSDPNSHTFLSFTWDDGRRGYFALSRGWWEPEGADLTYFIVNNMDHAHTHKLLRYEPTEWIHLACVWQAGQKGSIRFYANGVLVGEKKEITIIASKPSGTLYFGCDSGSYMKKGRWADSDFDEIALYGEALTDEQIFSIYSAMAKDYTKPKRDINGKLLEIRAVFDEGVGWISASGAITALERIKKAGFNVYVPCVWHGKGTRYPADVAPPETNLTFTGEDPLKRIIELAHNAGIEVHLWFTVALRQRDFLPQFYDSGTPDKAFDMHRAEFRKFITDVIIDVVLRYNVDGVNLDYIRTMGVCTCQSCQKDYRKLFGRNLLQDIKISEAGSEAVKSLIAWNEQAVEDVVQSVYRQTKSLKPRVIVSVDGHPQPSPHIGGRNAIKWANDGIVDIIFDMDFSVPPDVENHHYMLGKLDDPHKMIELIANYRFQNGEPVSLEGDRVARTVNYIRQRHGNGVGVYIYSLLNSDQVTELSKKAFLEPAFPNWQQPVKPNQLQRRDDKKIRER